MKKKDLSPYISATALVLIICLIFMLYNKFFRIKPPEEITAINSEIERILLKEILIDPLLVVSKNTSKNEGFFSFERMQYEVRLPYRYKKEDLKNIFSGFAAKHGMNIVLKEENNNGIKKTHVLFKFSGTIIAAIDFISDDKPKIAIILDDWGYNDNDMGYLEKIKAPLSIAIFPELKYTKVIAEFANKESKEVILHLPLQPKRNMPLVKGTIKANMSAGEIQYTMDKEIQSLPFVRGVNNHEGSLVTEKESAMQKIIAVLKEKNLFFIDSVTTGKSVAAKVAADAGVKVNKRDIFLDNETNASYIQGQLDQAKALAKSRGYAIAIGHDKPATLKVLLDNIPLLEQQGFEFVYAAEVVY